jgi:putative membrane protein insertion efficiency factor
MKMKKICIAIIKFYRKHLSHLKGHGTCIFYPTCSEYAKESIYTYGSIKGSYLAFKRIIKCNPLGPYCYDPVPIKEKKNEKKK